MKIRKAKGFTLIELMIVVAIIGILAAIAIPKFADLIRKSNEGATKGNLGSLRSALSIYFADNDGVYIVGTNSTVETVFPTEIVPKYMKAIPSAYAAGIHAKSAAVIGNNYLSAGFDTGSWGYDGSNSAILVTASGHNGWGELWVGCTHTDTKSKTWSAY